MRSFLSLLFLGILAVCGVARAEEYDSIEESTADTDMSVTHEPNMLLRLKSGVTFPVQNGEISHLLPVTLDWSYTGFENFSVGAELTWSMGSHQVGRVDFLNLQTAIFDLHKSAANVLATADYRFRLGNARILTGAKIGAIFYRESYTFAVGPTNVSFPRNESKTLFALGPSLNVDMPVKGPFFVNLGGDYLFSENVTQSGTLYAGLGADF